MGVILIYIIINSQVEFCLYLLFQYSQMFGRENHKGEIKKMCNLFILFHLNGYRYGRLLLFCGFLFPFFSFSLFSFPSTDIISLFII